MAEIDAYINSPKMIGENKLPPRFSAFSYDDVLSALCASPSPYAKKLSGTWEFCHIFGTVDDTPDELYNELSRAQTTVPSVWQLNGYGKPVYLSDSYPDAVSVDKKVLPHIDPKQNEIGIYTRLFTIPAVFRGCDIYLRFCGVKSAFFVFLNGRRVAFSKGSMTPAEFNVTRYVHEGENEISVKVYRYSDATYLEDQDMWFFSGIYRDVWLYAESRVHISDIYADALLERTQKSGVLKVTAEIENTTGIAEDVSVESALYYGGAQLCCEQKPLLASDGTTSIGFAVRVMDVLPWSAEHPHLYSVCITLRRGERILCCKALRVGFKRVEIVKNVLMFNGKPLKLRGVNRHNFDPDFGWAVPDWRIREDLILLRRANVNAIRTSHYPNPQLFYELCDELGFYVMDECDLETHGVRKLGIPGRDELWREAMLDRARRMVVTDRSHACVTIWSLGNEAGDGPNFALEKQAILELDSRRPVHYECDRKYAVSDFISRMYPDEDAFDALCRQKRSGALRSQIVSSLVSSRMNVPARVYAEHPVVLCEYAHCMENSLGNFEEYTERFNMLPHMCGGFVWDFVDQSIHKIENGVDKYLYGGDFDEGRTSGRFCANGIVSSNRVPHPAYFQVKKGYAPVTFALESTNSFTFSIKNLYSFTDLSEYLLCWRLDCCGKMLDSGRLEDFSLEPLCEAHITLPVELASLPAQECVLTLSINLREDNWYAQRGYETAFAQFVVNEGRLTAQRERPSDGEPQSVADMLTLRPSVWRAMTDNDMGFFNFYNKYAKYNPLLRWKKANDKLKIGKTNTEVLPDGSVRISARWHIPFAVKATTEYTYSTDNTLHVRYDFCSLIEPIRVGLRSALSETLNAVEWYGRGPHENYCDRKTGCKLGLHTSRAEELTHMYMTPQENGHRTDVRFVEITDEEGHGIRISSAVPFEFSLGPYSVEQLEQAKHIWELKRENANELCIDCAMRGVGGDLPGVAMTHKPYRLRRFKTYTLEFDVSML